MIEEYKVAGDALNDVALRVQQILIGMQVYKDKLEEAGAALPDLHISGYDLNEIPVMWGSGKTPEYLAANIKKSITFTLLNALNCHLYLLDGFLVRIAKRYFNLTVEDNGEWVTPEVFHLATGIDLTKLIHWDAIEDMTRYANGVRNMKKTLSINVSDYFELHSKIMIFLTELSITVSEKMNEKKKLEGSEGLSGKEE